MSGTPSREKDSDGVPSWVRDKLNELERDKSDRAVVKAEVKRLESRMEGLAGDIGKTHCAKEAILASFQGVLTQAERDIECNTREIRGAYKWILRSLAALILFLITVAGGFVWYLAGMSFALKAHGEAIQEINKKLEASRPPALDLAPLQAMMQATATQAAKDALKQAVPLPSSSASSNP